MGHWIKALESALVDLVDFGRPDRDQTQMINSEPSIALVKSNSCDLILHSTNERAKCGCLWTHLDHAFFLPSPPSSLSSFLMHHLLLFGAREGEIFSPSLPLIFCTLPHLFLCAILAPMCYSSIEREEEIG